MVTINELRISNTDRKIIIDVSVPGLEYFDNIFIDRICIDTQDTYSPTGVSVDCYEYVVEGDEKNIRLEILEDSLELSLDNNLFFVYIETKGSLGEGTPNYLIQPVTMAVTNNLELIYKEAIKLLGEINKECVVPKAMMDFVFRVNGLDLALKTGNYVMAIDLWNKYFKERVYINL